MFRSKTAQYYRKIKELEEKNEELDKAYGRLHHDANDEKMACESLISKLEEELKYANTKLNMYEQSLKSKT